MFNRHIIDLHYPTGEQFDVNNMTSTDDDLRELGIGALGARKKMLLAIQGGLYYLADMVNPRQMHERCMETLF